MAIGLGVALCLGALGLVALVVLYWELLLETPPNLGFLHRLIVSIVFALAIAAVVTALLGHVNLLLAGGIGVLLGLEHWLWLDSLADLSQVQGRRSGLLHSTPRPGDRTPRRGRA